MNLRAILSVSVATTIIFAATCHVPAQAEQQPGESVVDLIRKLPNAGRLPEGCRVPEGVTPTPNGPGFPLGVSKDAKEVLEKKVEEYHKNIAALADQFHKLRSYLKPGISVFDYPGLLAKGRLHYNETNKTYGMVLGVYDEIRRAGSQGEFGEYLVVFDSKGAIREVKGLVAVK